MHSTATQQNPIYCKYNHNKSNENIQSIASSKIHLWHAWNEIFESIFQNTHTHAALEAIKKDAFKPNFKQTQIDFVETIWAFTSKCLVFHCKADGYEARNVPIRPWTTVDIISAFTKSGSHLLSSSEE